MRKERGALLTFSPSLQFAETENQQSKTSTTHRTTPNPSMPKRKLTDASMMVAAMAPHPPGPGTRQSHVVVRITTAANAGTGRSFEHSLQSSPCQVIRRQDPFRLVMGQTTGTVLHDAEFPSTDQPAKLTNNKQPPSSSSAGRPNPIPSLPDSFNPPGSIRYES